MIYLGIDPGTQHIGVCLYDARAARVLASATLDAPEGEQWTPASACDAVETWAGDRALNCAAVERTEWRGMGGPSLLETTEIVGAMMGRFFGVVTLRRREVLKALRIPSGTSSQVRAALIESHGGTQSTKKGGALHGVANHRWDALAVAMAAATMEVER